MRFWDEDSTSPVKVMCLPGAPLNTLIEAGKEISESELILFQSGIPHLHVKGERATNYLKLEKYKELFTSASSRTINHVIHLLIYPPYNCNQDICVAYNDLNRLIQSLNEGGTPNTVSRIFHRDHKSVWRVEA